MQNSQVKRMISRLLLYAVFFLTLPQMGIGNSVKEVVPPSGRDTILVGSEPDYPPFCIIDPAGNPAGFSVDLFKAAAAAAGLNVRFITDHWNELKEKLRQGKLDALPLVGRTPEREALFDFTIPYLTMHGAIIVRDSAKGIKTLADLRNTRVGVMKGDNAEEFLVRKGYRDQLVLYPSFEESLLALSNGQLDAVVMQRLVGVKLIKELGVVDLKIIETPIYDFEQIFCFAVEKGDKKLVDRLNEGLSIVLNDGTFVRIRDQWFGADSDINTNLTRIEFGGDFNYPPYEYLDGNGQPAGFNIDLIRAIAREMGLLVDIKLDQWSKIRAQLENGQIDAITGMFYASERDSLVEFSSPHSLVSQVFVYRKGDREPLSLTTLQGFSVLVQQGDIMHDMVQKIGNPDTIIAVGSQVDALSLLAQGSYDCAILSRTQARYFIDQMGIENILISHNPIMLGEYCFGIRKGNYYLANLLNEGLTAIKVTGEYRRIYDKWLGVLERDTHSFRTVIRYVAFFTVPLLLLLLAAIVWTRTLQNRVAARTANLQESEARLRQIAENSHQVFWLTDWNKKELLYVSPAFEEIYQMPVERAYQDRHSWKDPIHPDDRDMVDAVFQEGSTKGVPVGVEYRIVRKNNEIRWIYDRSFPVRNEQGELYRFVSIAEDITPRKEMELSLQRANLQLEIAKEKAEESDRLKTAFLANMSHEIRTPMNGILGFAELLEEPHLEDEEQKRYVKIIQQSGERMLSLINEIIDISKIEAGEVKLNQEIVGIEGLFSELENFFIPEAQKKGLTLKFSIDGGQERVEITTDRARLNQILTNLIKNALKFTFSGSVEVNCKRVQNRMDFWVTDTGIGIPPDLQGKVFERFARSNNLNIRDQEGAGLGLSICHSLVTLLGGHLWVESEPGKGSTFGFSLPEIQKG